MANNSLQIRKESIFKKIANFIKGLFRPNTVEIQEEPIANDKVEVKQNTFWEDLRIEPKEENPELMKLQKQFETNELDLCVMSNEQVHDLKSLYERQIKDLKKNIDNKKTELNIIKTRIKNYSADNI